MIAPLTTQFKIDAAGVARPAGTRTMVNEVMLDSLVHG